MRLSIQSQQLSHLILVSLFLISFAGASVKASLNELEVLYTHNPPNRVNPQNRPLSQDETQEETANKEFAPRLVEEFQLGGISFLISHFLPYCDSDSKCDLYFFRDQLKSLFCKKNLCSIGLKTPLILLDLGINVGLTYKADSKYKFAYILKKLGGGLLCISSLLKFSKITGATTYLDPVGYLLIAGGHLYDLIAIQNEVRRGLNQDL